MGKAKEHEETVEGDHSENVSQLVIPGGVV